MTYIEATIADIEVANRLAHDVLGRSLDDLAPQTRRLLGFVDTLVARLAEGDGVGRDVVRFTRRQVREHSGWSDFQVRTHLSRLVELEYVLVHRGGRGQSFVYELLFDGHLDDPAPRLAGLIDTTTLDDAAPAAGTDRAGSHVYDTNPEGRNTGFEGPSRGHRAGVEHTSSTPESGPLPGETGPDAGSGPETTDPGLVKRPVVSQSHLAPLGVGA